jgi:hypothetical protein
VSLTQQSGRVTSVRHLDNCHLRLPASNQASGEQRADRNDSPSMMILVILVLLYGVYGPFKPLAGIRSACESPHIDGCDCRSRSHASSIPYEATCDASQRRQAERQVSTGSREICGLSNIAHVRYGPCHEGP